MSPHIIAFAIALILSAAPSFAQSNIESRPRDKDSGAAVQPQGPTGPLNTKSSGAPAASPQGETPAGMQAAPKGSSETIRTNKDGIPEGTPRN
jgi:hypothetical protein